MRHGWLLAVVACGGGSSGVQPQHDAARCTSQGAPQPQCSTSCGNGVIDTCWFHISSDDPCHLYEQRTEACDGSAAPSCASLGYGRGTAGCNSDCTVNVSACDACGSDARVVACGAGPINYAGVLVASPSAASGGPFLALASDSTMRVLHRETQGFAAVGSATVTMGAIESIAPLVDGWLIVSSGSTGVQVTHSDLLATTTVAHTLATGNFGNAEIAYGPGGHALVAWIEYVLDSNNVQRRRTWTAIVDATGATVVAPSMLFSETDDLAGASVTSDGTSFFVGVDGRISRLASNGTVAATVTGFPMLPTPQSIVAPVVRWGTSSGWYAAPQDFNGAGGQWTAQQFDATGAALGSAVPLAAGPKNVPSVDGSDLITASGATSGSAVPFSLVRVPPGGSPISSVPVGIVDETSLAFHTLITPFAGDVAVAWPGANNLYLALVAL